MFIVANFFILTGIFIKIGFAPFHSWVISVYTRISYALLGFFAVLPKFVYFFILVRYYYLTLSTVVVNFEVSMFDNYMITFYGSEVSFMLYIYSLMVGLFSVFFGSFGLLFRSYLNTFLAYSSILNLGFIIFLFGCLNLFTLKAMVFYIFIYFFILLGFLLAFILVKDSNYNFVNFSTGKFDFFKSLVFLKGNRKGGFLFFILTVFLLALAGLPPFPGFFIKLYSFYVLALTTHIFFVVTLGFLNVLALFGYLRFVGLVVFYLFENSDSLFFSVVTLYVNIFNRFSSNGIFYNIYWFNVFFYAFSYIILSFFLSFVLFFVFYIDLIFYYLDYIVLCLF